VLFSFHEGNRTWHACASRVCLVSTIHSGDKPIENSSQQVFLKLSLPFYEGDEQKHENENKHCIKKEDAVYEQDTIDDLESINRATTKIMERHYQERKRTKPNVGPLVFRAVYRSLVLHSRLFLVWIKYIVNLLFSVTQG